MKREQVAILEKDLEKNLKVLKESAGMLNGNLKKTPVSYQCEMRKEWKREK